MSFSRSLKQFRESENLSQREVARRIGVNESTYRQWEYGTTISGEPYPKIAEAFGITLDELFGLAKNPGKTPDVGLPGRWEWNVCGGYSLRAQTSIFKLPAARTLHNAGNQEVCLARVHSAFGRQAIDRARPTEAAEGGSACPRIGTIGFLDGKLLQIKRGGCDENRGIRRHRFRGIRDSQRSPGSWASSRRRCAKSRNFKPL